MGAVARATSQPGPAVVEFQGNSVHGQAWAKGGGSGLGPLQQHPFPVFIGDHLVTFLYRRQIVMGTGWMPSTFLCPVQRVRLCLDVWVCMGIEYVDQGSALQRQSRGQEQETGCGYQEMWGQSVHGSGMGGVPEASLHYGSGAELVDAPLSAPPSTPVATGAGVKRLMAGVWVPEASERSPDGRVSLILIFVPWGSGRVSPWIGRQKP